MINKKLVQRKMFESFLIYKRLCPVDQLVELTDLKSVKVSVRILTGEPGVNYE